jgi:hypothetical protein
MNKIVCKAFAIALPLSMVVFGCSKKQITPDSTNEDQILSTTVQSSSTSQPNGPGKYTPPTIQSFPDLAWFDNFANTYSYDWRQADLGTYTPAKAGSWDYDEVWLLDQGSSDVHEVYVFYDDQARNNAKGTNNKDYWEDANTHKMHCSGPGSLCRTDNLPCIVAEDTF